MNPKLDESEVTVNAITPSNKAIMRKVEKKKSAETYPSAAKIWLDRVEYGLETAF